MHRAARRVILKKLLRTPAASAKLSGCAGPEFFHALKLPALTGTKPGLKRRVKGRTTTAFHLGSKGITMPASRTAADYDGTQPFPGSDAGPRTTAGRVQAGVTLAIVLVPFAGLAAAVYLAWGHGVGLADVLLAVAFYAITGLGVTVGFHRLLTHRAFTAVPALRVTLAIMASMAFEGDAIGWVAAHRRHHAFTDRPGDPHSPYRYGTSLTGQLRGLADAHVGWLLRDDPTPPARYAPDLMAAPALRAIYRAFPARCALAGPAVRRGVGDRRYLARCRGRPAVGGVCPHRPAAARHVERQLSVPRVREPALHHPQPRSRHQPVATRPVVIRRKLAQHAPFRSGLRPARRRPRPG